MTLRHDFPAVPVAAVMSNAKANRGSIGLLNDWNRTRWLEAWAWVEPGASTPHPTAGFIRNTWRGGKPVSTVLIAGNRACIAPIIGERAERFLIAVFRELLAEG